MYSLAVVGYQMLAGSPPFNATSAAALLMKHVGERPVPIAQVRPDLPPGLAKGMNLIGTVQRNNVGAGLSECCCVLKGRRDAQCALFITLLDSDDRDRSGRR